MRRYLASRVGYGIVLIIAVVVINFLLTHVIPGSPVTAIMGGYPVPEGYARQVVHEFGLDQPLWDQLWRYLAHLSHFNLGYSFANRQPVLPLILHYARNTMLLMLPSLVVASVVGVLIGGAAARRNGSIWDTILTSVSLLGYSVPVFWLAQVLIVIFAVYLGVLPAQGMQDIEGGGLFSYLEHLLLPGFTLVVTYMAVVARVARASTLDAMGRDYILLALSKGLSSRAVFWRHALRNGLLPVITIIGYNFAYALTGAILTETVFGWPGIGHLFVISITNRDYPVLEGIFLLAALSVVIVNLATDLMYALADPRVRVSYAGK